VHISLEEKILHIQFCLGSMQGSVHGRHTSIRVCIELDVKDYTTRMSTGFKWIGIGPGSKLIRTQ
jgi:hypothetical protein